jgi:predicted phage tail protein
MLTTFEQPPLITIHFLGELGDRFGKLHCVRGRSVAELMQGVIANYPELRPHLYRNDEYAVLDVYGDRSLGEDELLQPVKELAIVPVVGGSGGNGWRIVLGTVLAVAGAFTGGSTLILAGIAMAGGAIVQMLSPKPKTPGEGARDESYLFNSSSGIAQDADPTPRAYGRTLLPAIVLNEDIDVSDLAVGN